MFKALMIVAATISSGEAVSGMTLTPMLVDQSGGIFYFLIQLMNLKVPPLLP